ncbi:hypothetical protein [Virgibacillus sediminis]|uniref:DUF4382 domain-containing protein n=1 Tax=Virgibacillus sediminis TaxID=202260 RepID=A0ABV7A8R0_9BACI
MKKMIWLLFLALALVLAACSNDTSKESASENQGEDETTEETGQEEQETENNESETNQESADEDSNQEDAASNDEEAAENKEDTVNEDSSEETAAGEEAGGEQGMKEYRPEPGMTKIFVQDDEFEITYDIVAEDENHLQRNISFGDMVELQILNWTSDRIELVYKESNPEDTSSKLDSFEAINSTETILDVENQGEGDTRQPEIISTTETVSVPAGTYENVYVVRSTTTSSTTDNQTIFTTYFAPGVGVVKETMEATGENGYTSETVLTEVNE